MVQHRALLFRRLKLVNFENASTPKQLNWRCNLTGSLSGTGPLNLLVISHALPPSLYPQSIQVGRLLNHLDHRIHAITNYNDPNREKSKDVEFNSPFKLFKIIEVKALSKLPLWATLWVKRIVPIIGKIPDEHRQWARQATKVAIDYIENSKIKFDVIITFGEPMSSHLVGLELNRRYQIPWIAHFSDPWSDNPFRRLQKLSNVINQRLESQVLNACDLAIFNSIETVRLVTKKYPNKIAEKCDVLPHSFDRADFLGHPRKKPNGKITIRFIGNFYNQRNPFPLFRAIRNMLIIDPGIFQSVQFELIGHTPKWMKLWLLKSPTITPYVTFHQPVSYQQSLKLMSTSDALLIIDAASDLSVFLPSKLIDYIGARKPIMGIVPFGASRKLILELEGIIADPKDDKEVAAMLHKAISGLKCPKKESSEWTAPEVRKKFEVATNVETFNRLIRRCIAGEYHEG